MTKFVYNTNNTPDPKMTTYPLFSDMDQNSKMSQKLFRAKQVNGENYWSEMREILAHDFKTLPLERFKVWASVLDIPFMSKNNFFDYIRIVTQAMVDDLIISNAVKEPIIGYTKQDFDNHFSMFYDFPTTMNRIQHMAHLVICEYTPEQLSKMNTIVEYGAGIGDMADIVFKLGFKGRYIIFDFPEVINIQRWYHNALGHKNIEYISSVEDIVDSDLSIATWSFTEMPISLRNEITAKTKSKNWLIAYSNKIFNIDNNTYIKENFVSMFTNHDIVYIDIPFMPWDNGAKYLTVKEKA